MSLIVLTAPGMPWLAALALTFAIATLLLRCSCVGQSETLLRDGRSHVIVPDGLRAPAGRRAIMGALPTTSARRN